MAPTDTGIRVQIDGEDVIVIDGITYKMSGEIYIYPEDEDEDEDEEEEQEEEQEEEPIMGYNEDEVIVVDGEEMILRGNKCYYKSGVFHAYVYE